LDSIVSNVVVVPEFNCDGGLQPTEDYRDIQNKIQWLDYFCKFNGSNGSKLYMYPQLYAAYSCAEEGEAFDNDETGSGDVQETESKEKSSDLDTDDEEDSDKDSLAEELSDEEDSSDKDSVND